MSPEERRRAAEYFWERVQYAYTQLPEPVQIVVDQVVEKASADPQVQQFIAFFVAIINR